MQALENRRAAGRLLAEALLDYQGSAAVVLGITRGGVVVAQQVAHALRLPFDALVIQRIEEPGQAHASVGAVAESGHLVVCRRRLRRLSLDAAWLGDAAARSLQRAQERATYLRESGRRQEVTDLPVILVDDSAATGTTLRAAVRCVRALHPRAIIVAIPVAPQSVLDWLTPRVDRVECLYRPAQLIASRTYYPSPLQESDADLRGMLA
jgi:putative phosphoribosyl transferase